VVLIAAADSARDSSKVKDARRRSAMRLGHQGLQKRQIPPLTESSCEGERRLEKATPGCLKRMLHLVAATAPQSVVLARPRHKPPAHVYDSVANKGDVPRETRSKMYVHFDVR